MTSLTVSVTQSQVLTANQRGHWATCARATKSLRTLAAMVWRCAGSPQHARVSCVVTISYPNRRKRDAHNLMPTIKAIIDGFTHPYPGVRGLLPDDDDQHLTGPDLRTGEVTPGRFTFRFDFEELP